MEMLANPSARAIIRPVSSCERWNLKETADRDFVEVSCLFMHANPRTRCISMGVYPYSRISSNGSMPMIRSRCNQNAPSGSFLGRQFSRVNLANSHFLVRTYYSLPQSLFGGRDRPRFDEAKGG
jgi:hypothetical protein